MRISPAISARDLAIEIVKARRKNPPTAKRLIFAINLGIEFDPRTITNGEIGEAIEVEVGKRSQEILRDNPYIAPGQELTYKDGQYVIDIVDRRRWRVRLTPRYPREGLSTCWILILTADDVLNGRGDGVYE